MDVRLSARLTLSGTCVYENENESDLHPREHAPGGKSELVKGIEGRSDRVRLSHEVVKMFQLLEEGYVNVNGYLGSVNESGNVSPNVNESAISKVESESESGEIVNDYDRRGRDRRCR